MVRRVRVVVASVVAALLVVGCGNGDHEREAAAAVTRLAEAAERGDGAAACEELTEDAAGELDEPAGQACETEIVNLGLTASPVAAASVSITSAKVDLAGGGSFFLDETPEGWKVSAAGCEPRPGGRYDCRLEG